MMMFESSGSFIILCSITVYIFDWLFSNTILKDGKRLFYLISLFLPALIFTIIVGLCFFGCTCFPKFKVNWGASLFFRIGKRFKAIGWIYHNISIWLANKVFLFLFFLISYFYLLVESTPASVQFLFFTLSEHHIEDIFDSVFNRYISLTNHFYFWFCTS